MKHNPKLMIIAVMASAFTAVSCDSYFDINTKDQATLEDIMSRSTAVRQYLAHLYAYIPNDENLRANEGGTSLRSDEALHAKSQYETNWYKVRRGEYSSASSTDVGSGNYWKKYYEAINECTTFIDNLRYDKEDSERLVSAMEGEARFLRAYYYFCLFRHYGPVFLWMDENGDPVASDQNINGESIDRNTVEENDILKLLYEYHCCPIQAHGTFEQEILKEMERKGWLEADNHLLSEEERNYFDYYLYNSKYTNSRALRNRYLHGSHVDADKVDVHRNAYNRLLILLILELLKIEDDLISKDLQKSELGNENVEEKTSIMLGQVAEVLTYSDHTSFSGKQLFLPKKLGTEDGYIFVNALTPTVKPAYMLQPNSGVIPEYIAFIMNSSLFRMSYTHQTSGKPTLNIERIKGFNLPYCDLDSQAVCGRLEHLIAQYQIDTPALRKEEKLQLTLFSNVRDFICFELFQPNFKQDTGIEFLNPFRELMQDITGDEKEQAQQIAEKLLKPGNVLMDNMKKARILLSDKKED